jgi:hypothetical protein
MTMHSFHMTEDQAMMIHAQVGSHMSALKNWIASAVEQGDLERAQHLVTDLRAYEKLYSAFNMPAKHDIAKHSGKPLETEHTVRG